jgi:excisionase family DNA binding protein
METRMTQQGLLSIGKVAARLDVSESTVRRLVEAGHLPKPMLVAGRLPRWSAAQVEWYVYALENGLLPPISEKASRPK